MPVDFATLPPLEPVPDKPPSRWLWTMVFFVVLIVSVFAVLLLWPNDEPSRTPWFWFCLVVYPVGAASFVVLRRYSAFQRGRLDAIARNDARSQYVTEVFDGAGRPVQVLANAYRFSSDPEENDIGKLLSGSLTLEPKAVPAVDMEPVNARWIAAPIADEQGRPHATDLDRQRDVLHWMFDELLSDIAPAILRLPGDARLRVLVVTAGSAVEASAVQRWESLWKARGLRAVRTTFESAPLDSMWLDTWLDRINENRDQEVRLLVFAQLHPVHEGLPPAGSAEAAAAILLAPPSLVERFHPDSNVGIHRPQEQGDASMEDTLQRALQWGRAKPGDIGRIWECGLDGVARAAATKACVKAGISGKRTDVDSTIGHAGVAATWLTILCAARAATAESTAQLVVTAPGGQLQLCIVRPTST